MNDFSDFHDGFLDGVWLSGAKRVHLFIRTESGERSTIVLKDVERLNLLNFKEGNIIFEIVLVKPNELTLAHIVQLYDIELAKAELAEQLHDEAKQLGLSALEINPSYGGECIILFRELGILPSHVLSQQLPQSQT